jgi:hypothetical protein
LPVPTAASLIAAGFKSADWSLISSATLGFSSSTSGSAVTGATVAPLAGQLDALFLTTDATETFAAASINPGTWTSAHAAAGTSQHAYVFYRIATGTEGAGLNVVGGSGTLETSVNWSRWNGALGASPLDVTVVGSTTATKAISSTASSTLGSAGELCLCYAGVFNTNAAQTLSAPVWTGGFTALNTTAATFRQSAANSVANWGGYVTNPATTGATAGLSWTGGANATEVQPLLVTFKPLVPSTGAYSITSGTATGTISLSANEPGTGYYQINETTPGTIILPSDYSTVANIIGPLVGGGLASQASGPGLVQFGATL